ncbi:hypothetical protein SpCBS45565_g03979 [Spizellomyces sp. 'palustris']|nr:hypothetical protein SpCBS45565_g03979 [Spizellomyces sp. 'palustris']
MNPAQPPSEAPAATSVPSEPSVANSFKQAAYAVTQLYKESLNQQKRSYNAGYSQCLQDLWQFVALQRGQGKQAVPVTDLVTFFAKKYEMLQVESAESRREEPVLSSTPSEAQPPPTILPQEPLSINNFTFSPPTNIHQASPASHVETPAAFVHDLPSPAPSKRRWNQGPGFGNEMGFLGRTFNWADSFPLEPAAKRSRWKRDAMDENDFMDD